MGFFAHLNFPQKTTKRRSLIMSKNYNIVLHYRDEEKKYQSYLFPQSAEEADERKQAPGSILDVSRHSTFDAVKFKEILNWLSQQLFLKNKDSDPYIVSHTLELHLKVLQYMRYSYAYRAYRYAHAEYAEVVRLRLIEHHNSPGYEPEMAEILEDMKKDGVFPHFNASQMEQVGEELSQQLVMRRSTENEERSDIKSYDEKLINKPPFNQYFERLGATLANTSTPEDYLRNNFDKSINEEPLLHVRECEDIGCSINPKKSPYTKLIPDNVRRKIVESVMKNNPNKHETIFYCGFASGLFGRDLKIIEDLINIAKKTEIELFFIDKSYETFINMTALDVGEPTLEEYIDTTFIYKSVTELAKWVNHQLDKDENNPLSIHLFSDIADAEQYLKNSGKKITLLVGQDFFTDKGCHSSRYSTPGAHKDFMHLARSSLSEKGQYFELIKDDLKEEVYSLKGTVQHDHEVNISGKVWNCAQRQSKIYENMPFSFFVTPEKDMNSEQSLLVKRQYDEEANLLEIKRYT